MMSLRNVVSVVGLLLVFVGLSMFAALGVSLLYRDGDTVPLLVAALLTMAVGGLAWRLTGLEGDLSPREGYAIVTFAWAGTAVFGALPYLFTGTIPSFWAAVFESMSGFTTTGATVFADIESLPHGVLFWRALTHWLGGMGIIVLAIAVLPYLGVGGMQLFKAEVPGPTPERLRPRIAQTAKLLWLVYVGMTGLQILLLVVGEMGWFDAVTHAFATVATGGFSTKNASLGHFESPYTQYVTIVFMYLAGINFTLHFRAAAGRFEYLRDVEWRFFTAMIASVAAAIVAVNLLSGTYELRALERAVRDGLFTVVSIVTTTGFVTADFEAWVPGAQALLFAMLFVGGMAGSTGGGMKSVRILLLLKQSAMELRKHLHPRAVMLARVGRHVVPEHVLANVIGFVILYLFIFLAGAVAMSLLGMDLETALGASAATVGNVGPGLGEVGATDNYGWLSSPALGILTFLMLVGRLEIYTVLLLFLPQTWSRRGGRRVDRGSPKF